MFKVKKRTLLLIAGIVWLVADLKAYIIMAVMMGGGIGFRAAGIFPDLFVSFFYSGLGCALALAGVLFVKNFINFDSLNGTDGPEEVVA